MDNNIISIFLIGMIVLGMGGINILGRVNALEPVSAGDELELFASVSNPTDKDIDYLNVKAIFFDLGEYVVSNEFNLDDGSSEGIKLSLDIPRNAPSGDHLVKIVVSNDDYYDSKFIYVNIISLS